MTPNVSIHMILSAPTGQVPLKLLSLQIQSYQLFSLSETEYYSSFSSWNKLIKEFIRAFQ